MEKSQLKHQQQQLQKKPQQRLQKLQRTLKQWNKENHMPVLIANFNVLTGRSAFLVRNNATESTIVPMVVTSLNVVGLFLL